MFKSLRAGPVAHLLKGLRASQNLGHSAWLCAQLREGNPRPTPSPELAHFTVRPGKAALCPPTNRKLLRLCWDRAEGRGRQRLFRASGLLASGGGPCRRFPGSSPSGAEDCRAAALVSPDLVEVAPGCRDTGAKRILRAVGSGTRKVLYERPACPLSSKNFKEEKFSKCIYPMSSFGVLSRAGDCWG